MLLACQLSPFLPPSSPHAFPPSLHPSFSPFLGVRASLWSDGSPSLFWFLPNFLSPIFLLKMSWMLNPILECASHRRNTGTTKAIFQKVRRLTLVLVSLTTKAVQTLTTAPSASVFQTERFWYIFLHLLTQAASCLLISGALCCQCPGSLSWSEPEAGVLLPWAQWFSARWRFAFWIVIFGRAYLHPMHFSSECLRQT